MPSDSTIRKGPKPKHALLRGFLIGMALPGQAVPSERELMVTYGVSRATVRKAIDALVSEGLLHRIHGVGTFAVRPRLEMRLHLGSFNEDMRRRGLTPSTRMLSIASCVPPMEVAEALRLASGSLAWHVLRLRLANQVPMSYEDGWYPAYRSPELDRHDTRNGSLDQLRAIVCGWLGDRADQTVWAESADKSTAERLRVADGTPLLVLRTISTAGGRPVEYLISRYNGDRYKIHMELSRDETARLEPKHQRE